MIIIIRNVRFITNDRDNDIALKLGLQEVEKY